MIDFEKLVAEAHARFAALSPEEQAEHRREQRRSFVRGQLMMTHPDMTLEEANRLVANAEKDHG